MDSSITRRSFLGTMAAVPLASSGKFVGTNPTNRPAQDRPNILWIAVEDISPFLGCYGYDNPTPNLDRLAEGGVRLENAFMPAPVCSPCRSAMITGAMATTFGTHNHHSSRTEETSIRLPDHVKTLPELFREAGYFTFNQGKDDYNFWYDREALYAGPYTTHPLYGKSGGRDVGWRDRQPGQPFFGQIQLSGGKEIYAAEFISRVRHPVDRAAFDLPPYYPDVAEVREDWAQHFDCIQLTDNRVGEIIDQLREDGLLDNTIVIFFSDHGMRLWRHKQFCNDSGLHVPVILSWAGDPERLGGAGIVRDDFVSGLDISATSLALAGIAIPEYVEGRDLFAEGFRSRDHVVSARDRCDYTIDRIRSIRTARFRYIRNFFPDRPYMQPNYRDEWEITQLMRRLHSEGKLDPVQDRFWSKERASEELYDLEHDPFEIRNLAFDADYRGVLVQHRRLLTQWIDTTDDRGRYPEDSANLKYMLDVWRERGVEPVNPEYDHLKG
ncbi:sulfatase [Gemmatimonadota bacterium]